MTTLGLEGHVVDENILARTAAHFQKANIVLPTFAELADPTQISADVRGRLAEVDPDAADPLNLFRVHWFNSQDRKGQVEVPQHVVLPKSLTGVDAPIIVVFGDAFPMINAHKVLAAYACLAPRIITGQFDPSAHRAIWPSTGNYCRGGVAISRIMDCHGVAVLPEGMSRERFEWLERWIKDPNDVVRTPGTESNVKEIYDECARLDADPENVIFNQFCEFGNHLAHYQCTGRALGTVFESVQGSLPGLNLAGYVSATGSAGTLAAGDYLKQAYGARITAVEAVECPTMLYNGFGEHNIQGIGDKHIPYIHNVMNTDVAVAISDSHSDALGMLFNTEAGRSFLMERKGLSPELVDTMSRFGFSGIANTLAAIKTAKHFDFGPDQAVITVATDGWPLYASEEEKIRSERFGGRFDQLDAAETWGRCMADVSTDHTRELTYEDRNRIFNLGYYTWVEQQGVDIPQFEARRKQDYWTKMRPLLNEWDRMIGEFNARASKG